MSEDHDRILELEDELRHRMAELELKHDELRHAKLDIAVKDEHLAALQAGLAMRAKSDRFRGHARHRLGTATAGRFPVLYRWLKRILDRVEHPRS
jgi:hypothetical protein